MTTATESMMDVRDRDMDERSLHGRMKWFTEKWTAELRSGDAGEFQADLLLLVQAIHRDANRETHRLLVSALSAAPPSPVFIEKNSN